MQSHGTGEAKRRERIDRRSWCGATAEGGGAVVSASGVGVRFALSCRLEVGERERGQLYVLLDGTWLCAVAGAQAHNSVPLMSFLASNIEELIGKYMGKFTRNPFYMPIFT